jgi:hypothetical protein
MMDCSDMAMTGRERVNGGRRGEARSQLAAADDAAQAPMAAVVAAMLLRWGGGRGFGCAVVRVIDLAVMAGMMIEAEHQMGRGADGRHEDLKPKGQGREKRDSAASAAPLCQPRPHAHALTAVPHASGAEIASNVIDFYPSAGDV